MAPPRNRKQFVPFNRLTIFGRRWFFHYQTANGEIVFPSEAYKSAAARDKGILAARTCFDAEIAEERT